MKSCWIFLFCFLTGCLSAPPVNDFKMPAPVPTVLNVSGAQINIENKEISGFDNSMPTPSAYIFKHWAEQQFIAGNLATSLKAIIFINAQMTKTEEVKKSFWQLQNERYQLNYSVRIDFNNGDKTLFSRTVTGFEFCSIPIKSSLKAKKDKWLEMLITATNKVKNDIVENLPAKFIF